MLSKLRGNAQKHHCRARSDSAAEVRALCVCGHLVLLVSQCLVTCGQECGKEGEMLTQVTTPPLSCPHRPMGGKLGLAGCSRHHSQVLKPEPLSLMPSDSQGMVCKPQYQLSFSRIFPAQQTERAPGLGVSVVQFRSESFGKQPRQANAYTPEGRSGFQQEGLGRAANTPLSLAFSKSPLESPDGCPACLTQRCCLVRMETVVGRGGNRSCAQVTTLRLPQPHTELGP